MGGHDQLDREAAAFELAMRAQSPSTTAPGCRGSLDAVLIASTGIDTSSDSGSGAYLDRWRLDVADEGCGSGQFDT